MTHVSRRRTRRAALAAVVLAATGLVSACLPPPPAFAPVASTARAPQWPVVADPHVMVDGGTYYVYGSDNSSYFPVRAVTDLSTVWSSGNWQAGMRNAMPNKPAWAADWHLWAPTVEKFGNQYVAFFAAKRTGAPNPANGECIGRAVSSSPLGPFVAEAAPFSCGLAGWRGALDPSIFRAPNGQIWLYAAFSDTQSPIYGMPLNAAGDAFFGRPGGFAAYTSAPVLGMTMAWEGRFIENPSMTWDPASSSYLLAYSAGDWWRANYSTGLARCTSPTGPCTPTTGPWLTASATRTGPGGLAFFKDTSGAQRAVYASYPVGFEGIGSARGGTVARVSGGSRPQLVG